MLSSILIIFWCDFGLLGKSNKVGAGAGQEACPGVEANRFGSQIANAG